MDAYFKISNYLDNLIKRDLTTDEIEANVEELLQRARHEQTDVRPILLRKLARTSDGLVASLIALVFQRLNDSSVVKPLMDLLHNPAIDDSVKISLLPVLSHYGVHVADSAIGGFFRDVQASYRSTTTKMLDELTSDENMISLLLEDFSKFTREMQLNCVAGFVGTGDERALPILGTLAEYWDRGIAEAAISGIAGVKSSKSIAVLEGLFNHRETCWGTIQKAICKLEAQGILRDPIMPTDTPVLDCFLTHIDGRGSRILVITRETDPQLLDAVFLMLNERVGIKDCHGSRRMPMRDFRQAVTAMKSEMPLIRVEYSYALSLVRDGLFTARKNQALISPEFSFRRRIFGNDDLTPQEHQPKFSELLLADIARRQARLLATSTELLFEPPFEDWWMDIPASYQFVQRHRPALRSRILSERIIRAFLEDIVEPDRHNLGRRLALTAEMLEQAKPYPPKRKLHIMLALWQAVKDESVPLHTIPFFIELVNMTIGYVLDNIEMGFQEPESFLPEYYRQ